MKKFTQSMKRAALTVAGKLRDFFRWLSEKHRNRSKAEPKFRFTYRFGGYLLLILFAIIFTQALKSTVSAVIFVFLCILPFLSLLYLLISLLSIKVYLDSDSTEVEKFREVDFSLVLANESPLPFPFVEAMISVPGDDAVRCIRELTRLSLIPFGRYEIQKKLSFAYRGGYNIGVSDVFVTDLFGLFRIRMDVGSFREIFVLPRRLTLSSRFGSDRDSEQTESVNRYAGSDRSEVSDIRSYQIGDPLRAIHWKLSSKTEELQVRQYSKNSERQAVILCDTARRYRAPKSFFSAGSNEDKPQSERAFESRYADDIDEFVADGVIETALALAEFTLSEQKGAVTLVWFDERSESGVFGMRLESPADLDEIYRTFATAPLTETASTVGDLAALVASGADQLTYRFVTGCIDPRLAASLSGLTLSGSTSAELYSYLPLEKVLPDAKDDYFAELNAAEYEIERAGVRIFDARDGKFLPSSNAPTSDSRKEASEL